MYLTNICHVCYVRSIQYSFCCKMFFLVQSKCDRRTENRVSLSSQFALQKYSLWYNRVSHTMTTSRVHSQNRNKINDEYLFLFSTTLLFVSVSIEYIFWYTSLAFFLQCKITSAKYIYIFQFN